MVGRSWLVGVLIGLGRFAACSGPGERAHQALVDWLGFGVGVWVFVVGGLLCLLVRSCLLVDEPIVSLFVI